MSSHRMLRVNELLKREIADLLERAGLSVDNSLISVSEVHTSHDLKHAKVHLSLFGGNEDTKSDVLKYCRKHRGLLQKKIASVISLKFTPVLEFTFDTRIEDGAKVLAILDELNVKS